MAKLKSSETLSLDKSKQKKVVKQTQKLKKKIQDGNIPVKKQRSFKATDVKNRGLVYIGHIPHGFYENEMKKYFGQFGKVTNVKVCRSRKTGGSKGFGYIEFLHAEVARIAAETMNNYLMFKKRVVAEYVPFEKRPEHMFKGRSSTATKYSSKTRLNKQRLATMKMSEETYLKRSSARLSKLNKKLNALKDKGIDYDFKPVDVPQGILEKTETTIGKSSYTFEQDPYDSDIEVKVPIKSKTSTNTPKRARSKRPKKQTVEATKTSVKSKLEAPKTTVKPKPASPKKTLERKSEPSKRSPKKTASDHSNVKEKIPKKVVPQQTTRSRSVTKVHDSKETETPKKTPKKVVSKQTPKKNLIKQTSKQKITKRKRVPAS